MSDSTIPPVDAAAFCSVLTVAGAEKLFAEALVKAGLGMPEIERVTRLYNESKPTRQPIILKAGRQPGIAYTSLDAVARQGSHGARSPAQCKPNDEVARTEGEKRS